MINENWYCTMQCSLGRNLFCICARSLSAHPLASTNPNGIRSINGKFDLFHDLVIQLSHSTGTFFAICLRIAARKTATYNFKMFNTKIKIFNRLQLRTDLFVNKFIVPIGLAFPIPGIWNLKNEIEW